MHIIEAAKAVHAPVWLQYAWIALVIGACVIGVGAAICHSWSGDDWSDLYPKAGRKPKGGA